MGYSKLSNNKYKITIELDYDILGKRKTEIFNGSLAEVKMRDAELTKKHYKKSNTANINNLTFEQYSKVFLKRYCQNNIGLVTKNRYEETLKKILPIIGKMKLNKITLFILDSIYQELKVVRKKQILGYHPMYEFYKLINVMYNQAIKMRIIR